MATTAATKGAKPRSKGKRGQPTALDRAVPLHAKILPSGAALAELIATGMAIKEAAQHVGVDPSGAMKCLGDGRVVAGMLWEGRLAPSRLTAYQRHALEYFRLVDAAEVAAEHLHTDALRRHATGGNIRKRTTEVRDDKGQLVSTTTMTEELPPDPRVSLFWLERRRPDRYGRVERREHALVGGDPQVGVASPRDRLAEALAQIARRKEQGAGVVAAMHGGVIDVPSTEAASA